MRDRHQQSTNPTITLPVSLCPACGYEFGRAMNELDHVLPHAGDVGVCEGCAAVLIIKPDFACRAVTCEDYERMPMITRARIGTLVARMKKRIALSRSST